MAVKTTPTSRWAAVLVIAAIPSVSRGAAPKLIASTPANDTQGVDPGLRELRFEFDRDMNRSVGWSICGSGPSFPKVIGNPKWVDPRTLSCRVKLEPGRAYVLSLNCENSDRRFRSVDGAVLKEHVVRFRTAGGLAEQALSQDINRVSVETLRRLLAGQYSYRDRRNIDWDEVLDRHADKLIEAATLREFAERAGRLLAKARDPHIWLEAGGSIVGSFQRKVRPNLSYDVLKQKVPHLQEHNDCVASGRLGDDIGYLLIRSWGAECADALDPAYALLAALREGQGLIVDVRPNSGGSEPLAAQFAGCFVDEPAVYSRNLNIDDGQFHGPYDRMLQPNRKRPRFEKPVVVLMGPANMSSCESFLLMMKQAPNCTLLGEASYGSSGNPKPYELPNGVTVYLPSWRDLLPDGTPLEGRGVMPDVRVKVSRKRFAEGRDPVLDAALEFLRRGQE